MFKSKWTIIVILAAMLSLGLYFVMQGGKPKTNTFVKYYDSLEDAEKTLSFEPDIPEYVRNHDELQIRVNMGQILELGGSTFVFKAASYVDVNADPLGLYEKADTDNKYTVENSNTNIDYFRYRQGYSGYETCTIINWCTDEVAYGMLINGNKSVDETLEIIGLTKDELRDIEEEISDNTKSITNTNEYNLDNKYIINLPEFKSDVTQIDNNGYTAFYFNKKLVFVVLYNDLDIDTKAFDGQSEAIIGNGIVIKYLTENPFETSDDAYYDYNNFINTIDNILVTEINP